MKKMNDFEYEAEELRYNYFSEIDRNEKLKELIKNLKLHIQDIDDILFHFRMDYLFLFMNDPVYIKFFQDMNNEIQSMYENIIKNEEED